MPTQEHLQAVRPVNKSTLTNPAGIIATPGAGLAGVVYVACHLDASGKEVVLWEDILMAFKDALHVRHDLKILPFLKGSDLRTLEPYRIAAVPNVVLDVIVEGAEDQPTLAETFASRPISMYPGAQPRRNLVRNTMEITGGLASAPRTPQYIPESYSNYSYDGKEPLSLELPVSPPLSALETTQQLSTVSLNSSPLNSVTLPVPPNSPAPPNSLASSRITNDSKEVETFAPKQSPTTTEWIPRPATQRHMSTQFHLGQHFVKNNNYNGNNVNMLPPSPQNEPAKVLEWTLNTAQQGYAPSQFVLGVQYKQGNGVAQDYAKALEWLLKAANQGHADAQNAMGTMHENGQGVARSPTRAMEWYLQAAKLGNVQAQNNIGFLYEKGEGVPQDYAKAMGWILKAAHQGYDQAQFNVGVLYKHGRGAMQDYSKAMLWFIKASSQGHAAAQFNVGILYKQGLGVSQDYHKAMEWFLKAANKGDPDAQNSIGILYQQGQGVPQDFTKAMDWLLKSAHQGYAQAQFNVGVLYKQGQGVARSYQSSMEWFLKAAEQRYAQAQFSVGYMFERGQGVSQDNTKAIEWYTKAAEQGHVKAQENLVALKGSKQSKPKALRKLKFF
ncbi:hypothetical protein EC991_006864 [Linnemannia zychae]|nr:hypothetical protein EC991_006864 [Linnemannia zychae]